MGLIDWFNPLSAESKKCDKSNYSNEKLYNYGLFANKKEEVER